MNGEVARRPESGGINKREVADRLWPAPKDPKMSQADMTEVLLACSGYDGREVAPTMVRAWWSKLGGFYTLAQCLAAVDEYYDFEARRMMPSDVIERITGPRAKPYVASHAPPEADNPWSYANLTRRNREADEAEARERRSQAG
jgi:hypothetical protein